MLLKCPNCNTQYLLNSADLKPDGRTVECANCEFQWFKKPDFENQNNFYRRIDKDLSYKDNKENKLPSTYVKTQEPSLLNSIFVILLLFIIILSFFLIKNTNQNILLLKDYFYNFIIFAKFTIYNLMIYIELIISHLAKLSYQIINLN